MSNKAQRTAWNLTKLAGVMDPMDTSNGLYELGHDANMAMIDVRHLGVSEDDVPQQFVFVPQKEWDKAVKDRDLFKMADLDDPDEWLRHKAIHWYRMSTYHRFYDRVEQGLGM